MTILFEHLLEIGLPSELAKTFAEVIPTLIGGRESVYFARKLIRAVNIYAEAWDELTPVEVYRMELTPHKGLVRIARDQPWKLYQAVQEYVESRLDEEAQDLYMDGRFDAVLERLVNEARDMADESIGDDIDVD